METKKSIRKLIFSRRKEASDIEIAGKKRADFSAKSVRERNTSGRRLYTLIWILTARL